MYELDTEPKEPRIVSHCAACGEEIYEYEEVYMLKTGELLHRDYDCLKDYYRFEKKVAEI
jgi:hypothetical protein